MTSCGRATPSTAANPTPGRPNPMRPVAMLQARVLQVRSVPAGATAGYNARWTAERPSRLATIALGYADGVPIGGSGIRRPRRRRSSPAACLARSSGASRWTCRSSMSPTCPRARYRGRRHRRMAGPPPGRRRPGGPLRDESATRSSSTLGDATGAIISETERERLGLRGETRGFTDPHAPHPEQARRTVSKGAGALRAGAARCCVLRHGAFGPAQDEGGNRGGIRASERP